MLVCDACITWKHLTICGKNLEIIDPTNSLWIKLTNRAEFTREVAFFGKFSKCFKEGLL